MPFIIVTAWFPLAKGTEAAEKYIEARKQYPPNRAFGKEILQGAIIAEGGRFKSITINEVKAGVALDEVMKYQQNAMIPYHDIEGYNARLSALQCSALRIKLRHLSSWTESRRNSAQKYTEFLQDIKAVVMPFVPSWADPVWHLYVILIENRDAVQSRLAEKGITTGLHYPIPLHLQKAYTNYGFKKGAYPVTESYALKLLSLPMFPGLTDEHIHHVAECLKEIVSC